MWLRRQLGNAPFSRPSLGVPRLPTQLVSLSSESLKTAADRQAEDRVLKKLVDVVNQRDALIRFQEECRLSELAFRPETQG